MKNNTDSAYQDAVARGNMYRFLAAIYLQPPTQEMLLNVIDAEFLDDLASLFNKSPIAQLHNYTESVDLEKETALIQQDYMDLFAVPAGRYVTRVQAIAVKIMYRMAGAEMERNCKELPTHIGVELSFMNFLCEKEAAAINCKREGVPSGLSDRETAAASDPSVYRELQSRFLQAHLNDWFPQLSQVIQEKANTHFYRALAQITEEFISQDTARQISQTIADKRAQVVQRSSAIPQPG